MYSVGQKVLYGSNGVCNIEDITVKHIGKADMEYYVLKPLFSSVSTLFVPTHNEALVGKIRSVLSAEEIKSILDSLDQNYDWIDNKLERTEAFKAIIVHGDFAEIIKLVRAIRFHSFKLSEKGKRLHLSDERILKEAERMVCDEVALVLNINRDEALKIILK